MEIQLWGRLVRGQKILKSLTVPCDPSDIAPALETLCHGFDVQRPLFLQKHAREMAGFGRTAFTKDHFMEAITFTRLEIEVILPEEEKKKRPRDPRIEA